MTRYLQYKFEDTPQSVSTFDELPLWSASFGLMLLEHVELKPNLTVLDLGSGAGFPLLELAQRLGSSCKCYGLDPWENANDRAKQKITNYDVANVEIISGSATSIPFADNSIDLIVSNLGINNFEEQDKVFAECKRVLKPGGKLSLTTNMNGHFKEFYIVFEETLRQLSKTELLPLLAADQEHRGNVVSISKKFTDVGLGIGHVVEDSFKMRFLDGSAFLNHYFIKLGWLSSWKNMIPEAEQENIFQQLEDNLNAYAKTAGGLNLTVPMIYIEGIK